ncbi:hypothetical protein H257_14146 [Aphanomyces astaci]|uniref:subtilisin n=1 Tax=Aphanomyces astaci TaxID=112090 RepID=W4FU50_APHAT|nr:hypothetical protein H257_14146 [Aphanomyces astaci]ETV70491.1 hypothetical protein H257_14146 [Aphanomyces astaci]|eukprot:XP_009840203.1 hypothetical protein H257_14146 [Aphanomyces astaci]
MIKPTFIAAFAALATAKIAPSVHHHLESNEDVDVVVEFKGGNQRALETARLERASFKDRGSGIDHVRSLLESNMETSQRAAVELLSLQPKSFTTRVESFYINGNMHVYGANRLVLDELAKLDNVAHIRQPLTAQLSLVGFDDDDTDVGVAQGWADNNATSTRAANEWGVNLINAPGVWANGNRGEGVVVGIIDTGVLHTHNDLKGNWRSTYGWFDPTEKSPTPFDRDGHGTHVAGSAVGQNGIGVAPGATWIACRGCSTTSYCPEAALLSCAQWMLCPTDATGKNPKCELAPHVINNSWGYKLSTRAFQAAVDAWRAADIIPVFANGNSGRTCSTTGTPADYKNVIGVGNLGTDDKLAPASSRGPTVDGRIKPDVSAPGNRVRSAWHTGNSAYNTISGTSMASPHVAGAIALYLSTNKGAKYDQVFKAFTTTVDTKTLTPYNENCGGVSDSKYPNNNYGFGRINVASAIGGGVAPPSSSTSAPSPSKPSTSDPWTPATINEKSTNKILSILQQLRDNPSRFDRHQRQLAMVLAFLQDNQSKQNR